MSAAEKVTWARVTRWPTLGVACPHCGAGIGEPCHVGYNPDRRAHYAHVARKRALAEAAMADLTDEQLAEWEALEAAATEGPWDADGNGIHHGHECIGLTYHDNRKANAALIAAARNAFPLLLRALRDARAENEALRDHIGEALEWCNEPGSHGRCAVLSLIADVLSSCAARPDEVECGCARCDEARRSAKLARDGDHMAYMCSQRMIFCPQCGNKRCPRATWHGNGCTGSNEPSQPGSDYTAAAPTGQPDQTRVHNSSITTAPTGQEENE